MKQVTSGNDIPVKRRNISQFASSLFSSPLNPLFFPFSFLSRPLQINADKGREDALWNPCMNEVQMPSGMTQALGAPVKANVVSAPALSSACHLCVLHSSAWWPSTELTTLSCLLALQQVGGQAYLNLNRTHKGMLMTTSKTRLFLLRTSFVEADVCFYNSSSLSPSHSPQNNQGQVCAPLTVHASPAVSCLLPALLAGTVFALEFSWQLSC